MRTTLNLADLVWGNRSALLPHALVYAFSLDLVFDCSSENVLPRGGGLQAQQPPVRSTGLQVHAQSGGMRLSFRQSRSSAAGGGAARTAGNHGEGYVYHVQDEVLVKTGDGLARDVPVGEIRRTDQQIDVDETGTGSIRGRALLDADAGGRVAFTYQGVVRLSGDTMRYLQWRDVGDPNIQRSSFITVQSYSNWPRYRWLMENQLFGFGRLQLEPGAETNRGMQAAPMSLRFSYDLYVG